MAEETEFAMGAKASCVDGLCGEVTRMIFDPATETLTHLVIVPKHLREAGRIVPLNLVDTTVGEIRLRCTLAEFGCLDIAEETELVDVGTEGMGIGGMTAPAGISVPVQTVVEEIVPWGKQTSSTVSASIASTVRSGRWRASWSIPAITG